MYKNRWVLLLSSVCSPCLNELWMKYFFVMAWPHKLIWDSNPLIQSSPLWSYDQGSITVAVRSSLPPAPPGHIRARILLRCLAHDRKKHTESQSVIVSEDIRRDKRASPSNTWHNEHNQHLKPVQPTNCHCDSFTGPLWCGCAHVPGSGYTQHCSGSRELIIVLVL